MLDIQGALGVIGAGAIIVGAAISLTGDPKDDEEPEETFIENKSGCIMGLRSCRVEDRMTDDIPAKWNERRRSR